MEFHALEEHGDEEQGLEGTDQHFHNVGGNIAFTTLSTWTPSAMHSVTGSHHIVVPA